MTWPTGFGSWPEIRAAQDSEPGTLSAAGAYRFDQELVSFAASDRENERRARDLKHVLKQATMGVITPARPRLLCFTADPPGELEHFPSRPNRGGFP